MTSVVASFLFSGALARFSTGWPGRSTHFEVRMGWWQRLLGRKHRETVNPYALLERRDGGVEAVVLASLAEAKATTSGVAVSEEGALRSTAVLACVRILANSVAMLPLPVYRRLSPRGKERVPSHPLYPILQEQANPEMTAFELRRWLMQGVLLWGNCYAEIEWSARGEVAALWPLIPAQVQVERRGESLVYRCSLSTGRVVDLPAWKVLHVRGLSGDGVTGYSVVRQLINESVGLGLATQEFGSRFFGNGARPGVVLKHPGTLSDKAFANLKASWATEHEGLSNAHRIRILEEGMDVSTLGVPPEEAQFLETRKFQVTEIARAFGVPPHLIGDMERATFSNIEHQYMEFLQFSLGPYLRQIEQVIHATLMTKAERAVFFVEHLRESILQADTITRYQAHALGRQWGWLSVNDIRSLENMNPVEGGDEYLVPLNMSPADGEEEQPLPDAKSAKVTKGAKEKQLQEGQQQDAADKGE
jgi:HK97 family phage portal protein